MRVCILCCTFFFFKQKTAYEMRISDWSSDVCSSDLSDAGASHGVGSIGAEGCSQCRLRHQPAPLPSLPFRICCWEAGWGSGLVPPAALAAEKGYRTN